MPDWLIVVVMGVVEGVTEFLPISSTGHLIVVGELIKLPEALKATFEIVIQLGAVVAVVAFYWADLIQQARSVRTDRGTQRLWFGIVIAFIPAAILGLFFQNFITEILFQPVTVGLALIGGGLVFLAVERFNLDNHPHLITDLGAISPGQALAIGLFQTLALVPGVSRSGASIIGGLVTGLDRSTATQFSFYLAIPTLGLATLFELMTNLNRLSPGAILYIGAGAVVSGVVAWFSIGWLLRYVSKHSFVIFGYYRILIGVVILIVFM